MFLDCFQEEPRGVREGSFDVEGGDHVVDRVHVGDGALEEDGPVWGPARDGSPEAGGYVRGQVGTDAAQDDGPDDLDLRDCTQYRAPVVRVGPVPLFVEGADHVGPGRWQRGLPRNVVPQALGEDADEVGGEVIVRLRREAVVPRGFVFPETVAFWASWTVTGRFCSCVFWARLKTWERRSIFFGCLRQVCLEWGRVFCTERRLLWLARPGRKALARQAFSGRGGNPKPSSIAG